MVPDLGDLSSESSPKIDVISLKERGYFINIFLHAGMFRVKTLPAVRTPDSFFPIVPFTFVLP